MPNHTRDGRASVAVVVPSWNGRRLLCTLLQSLMPRLDPECSVVVVDNGSSDGTLAWLQNRHPQVRGISNSTNRGFAAAVNQGIQAVHTDWIAVLNNDAVVAPGWIDELVRIGEQDGRIGAVASRMMFQRDPDVVSSAGIRVDPSGGAWDWLVGERHWPLEPVEVFGASGGACLLRREMLEDVGLFEEHFFAYLEDVDLAWRARARGWKAILAPDAVVYHAVSSTAGEGSAFKRYYLARNKWQVIVRNYPSRGLTEHLATILAYDALSIANALAQGDRVPLVARAHSFRDLPVLLRQRRQLQARATVAWPELRAAMQPLESPLTLYRRGKLVGRLAASRAR